MLVKDGLGGTDMVSEIRQSLYCIRALNKAIPQVDKDTRLGLESAASASSADITFESVQKSVDACRALQPTDVPDVYVMTTAMFCLIRKDIAPIPQCSPLRMFGTPVEHYPTLREVHERCLELRDAGKKVGLVCQSAS